MSESIHTWSSTLLSDLGLRNYFTGRTGGVSPPPFDSLNLGLTTKDDPNNVLKNRHRVEEVLNLQLKSLTNQVHGNQVFAIRSVAAIPKPPDLPNADAVISNVPGLSVAIFFADCVPVYFWDSVTKSAGLAHAGWRGTLQRVATETLEALIREFGVSLSNVKVAIGPSIGPCCFEVGDDVAEKFAAQINPSVVESRGGRKRVDLWKSNRLILEEKGVKAENIELAMECTSCRKEWYYSYRRDKGETGRMAGVIQIPV